MRLSSTGIRGLAHLVAAAVVMLLTLALIAPGCGRASLELEDLPDGAITVDSGKKDGSTANKCSAATCPTGCCDASGVCQVGTQVSACGSIGGACADCVSDGFTACDKNQACVRTVATCDKTTCASGCCSVDAAGTPQCSAGISAKACGTGAATCADCSASGHSCDLDTKSCSVESCNATNCPTGCCVGSTCIDPGTDAKACGIKGAACANCAASSQTCSANGTCVGVAKCGPANCGGCCDPVKGCLVGGDAAACGKQGAACQDCASLGETCAPLNTPTERTCQSTTVTCGPGNCAGCCDGNTCVTSNDDKSCGFGGVQCKSCAAGDSCQKGICLPTSGCGNCAGCCFGNTCIGGNNNTACGANGEQCNNCLAQGLSCQNRKCDKTACGPNNCNGCCDATGTCVPFTMGPGGGQGDTSCGFGGGQCQDCTALGETCNFGQCQAPCGPGNCAGCCRANGTCSQSGSSNQSCGQGGVACENCTATGGSCDTTAFPRACTGAGTCPAAYPGCDASVTTPVTPALQGVCDTNTLQALAFACTNGADRPGCQGALQLVDNSNPACSSCMRPFAVDFDAVTGILLCIAPDLDATCNHQTACVVDCIDLSCNQCTTQQAADNCSNDVTDTNGVCAPFVDDTQTCAGTALAADPLCDPDQYNNQFGDWFGAVGTHFCGNGP